MSKKYNVLILCMIAGMAVFSANFCMAANTVKVAVVMPEGSTWTNTLHEMASEVEKASGKEIRFKIYAGGISGDEADVLRKMRVNRIHSAGFSGIGLGFILPEIRVLESVLLFKNHAEIDWVREQMFDDFAAEFEKKGFVLLGFFDGGFTYIFSKNSAETLSGVGNLKMWIWKGDEIAEKFLQSVGIKTFPLPMTDVNTGLETGMIDSFYAPPLAAIALQWYARVRYMFDYPLVNSTGGFLINKRKFDSLNPEQRKLLKNSVKKYCRKLDDLTRKENAEALAVIKDAGIVFTTPDAEQIKFFNRGAVRSYEKNIPGIYSQDLFDRVKDHIETFRKNAVQ